MNKQAQAGTILMHLYAGAFLVVVFILFFVLFTITKGSVASASTAMGDFTADQILADIMQKQFEFKQGPMTLQQGLNNDETRQDAFYTVMSQVAKAIEDADYSGYVILYDDAGKEVQSGNTELKPNELQASSSACWPFLRNGELKYFMIRISDSHDPGGKTC